MGGEGQKGRGAFPSLFPTLPPPHTRPHLGLISSNGSVVHSSRNSSTGAEGEPTKGRGSVEVWNSGNGTGGRQPTKS